MADALHEIVYASAAREPFGGRELEVLLRVARRKNARRGITGVLLHHEGSFLQVLEGPEAAVSSLYASIERDPRHDRLLLLRRGPIERRRFAEWNMGFVDAPGVDPDLFRAAGDGFVDFLRTGRIDGLVDDTETILPMLRAFRSGRYRRPGAAG